MSHQPVLWMRIWMFFHLPYPDPSLFCTDPYLDPDPGPSIIKQKEKTKPNFYLYVTSLWLFCHWRMMYVYFQKVPVISKEIQKKIILLASWRSLTKEQDPLVSCTDPRIRIRFRTADLRIHNNATNCIVPVACSNDNVPSGVQWTFLPHGHSGAPAANSPAPAWCTSRPCRPGAGPVLTCTSPASSPAAGRTGCSPPPSCVGPA